MSPPTHHSVPQLQDQVPLPHPPQEEEHEARPHHLWPANSQDLLGCGVVVVVADCVMMRGIKPQVKASFFLYTFLGVVDRGKALLRQSTFPSKYAGCLLQ